MTKGVGITNQSSGNLKVKQISRRLPAPQPAKPNIFSAGMNNDLPGWIDNKSPEAIQWACRNRIDKNESFGSGDLNQAQAGMKSILADEFSVQSKARTRSQILAAGSQFVRVGDYLFR